MCASPFRGWAGYSGIWGGHWPSPDYLPPPRAAGTAGERQARRAVAATRHATVAPSASTRTGRGTTTCAARACRAPRPWQLTQCPDSPTLPAAWAPACPGVPPAPARPATQGLPGLAPRAPLALWTLHPTDPSRPQNLAHRCHAHPGTDRWSRYYCLSPKEPRTSKNGIQCTFLSYLPASRDDLRPPTSGSTLRTSHQALDSRPRWLFHPPLHLSLSLVFL